MLRLEGLSKLTGAERYADDMPLCDFLWGMTVRSQSPRGRIVDIRFDPSVDWSQFTIVTHRDIPGCNEVYLIEKDQPILAATHTRHIHEAVVLLAHPDRQALRRAVGKVKVIVDELPPVFDPRAPLAPEQLQHGTENVFKALEIRKGDAAAALTAAPVVVEGEYATGAQEHVYIEPNAMIAWTDEAGVICVRGSLQCPYYVLNALKHAFAREADGVRVIQTPTGGGFGGKEDYPSIIAVHAALLAHKSGKQVKIIYDRDEDMAATTKRHPSIVRHRTGVTKDGLLLAQDIDIIMDGGAYVTLSPVVLSRGLIHAAGPYSCANVHVRGRAVLTNCIPHGAFRGFGAPQTHFANERHMDRIAAHLGMSPVELRRRNLLKKGQTTSTGQVIRDGVDRCELLDAALDAARYDARRQRHAEFNRAHPYLRRGMGVATFHHGAGFTGSGEDYLASKLAVAARSDGRVEVRSASTEMGQGTLTVFTTIAAEALDIPADRVVVANPDTHLVPNSGPTVASRTAMVVGHLIERACDDMAGQLGAARGLSSAPRGGAFLAALDAWGRENPGRELVGRAQYKKPEYVQWYDKTYQGDAYATFSWGAYVAEVEVDLRTFSTRVTDFVAVQDIGRVLNDTLAAGQVTGGVVQAIGWALMEECVWERGAMKNNQLTNYIIPTSFDVPEINVKFIQSPYAHGGGGAKGVGELPMDGPGPAILNAVADATGADPCELPLTPERLMRLIPSGDAP
ncbi:MAG: xanthine dehydrogenase family protein [Planctomycetes bacterium]|nr:xanthine dehydrogenase family protein [Planctomycetota bacterium]